MEHKKEDVLFFPRVWLYARTGSGHRSAAEHLSWNGSSSTVFRCGAHTKASSELKAMAIS